MHSESVYPDCLATVRRINFGGSTKSELLREFQKHSVSMNAQGETLFTALPETHAETYRLETIELTARQLGYPDGAMSAELFGRAAELGLSLCPLELAPYFRLQYLDQPAGFWITIASPRPTDRGETPTGFYLRRLDDGLWLRGYTADPEHVWDADDHFVFCRQSAVKGSISG
ncbi:helicase [bacterium]|nr:helicase [bacterium]